MTLRASGICKTFAGLRALDNVAIDLKGGEIHAVLGANGSGKSTLAKVLTGVYQPESGQISVGNRTVSSLASPHQANQIGIAVVHQEAPLIDSMTVAEGIALFRGYPTSGGRVLWDKLHAETGEMLRRFDVKVDPHQLAGKLSPAERALVALVIALDRVKTGLELLILDEVTASLPENQAATFLDRVSVIAKSGIAVMMVTHRLAELTDRVQRVTVLRDGQVVHSAPSRDSDHGTLIGLMMGPHQQTSAKVQRETPAGATRRLWATTDIPSRAKPAVAADPGPEIVLEAKGLAGRFMRDVSFTLRRGEIVGVAGLIESGITELPQVLGGLAPRKAGSLNVRGRDLPQRMTPRDAIDAGLMLLPVDRLRSGGIASMSITDNTLLPAFSRYWHAGKREEGVVDQVIAELDVRPPRPAALFGKLSGGNQQKVLLGKWLLMRPVVLVLEDPTSGVDPNARAKMFEVLQDAAREGVSILFLSTEPEQLADMCSRVLILRDGIVRTELAGSTLDRESISQWCYA